MRLLAYFGEPSRPCAPPQNACDNCLAPPATWDATEAARKALSCIYRFHQQRGQRFGAGHLIDVLRGKPTDKVAQHGHDTLSTFGIGADVGETQWRSVLRQLIALGYLRTEGEYNTLELDASARDVLRGEVQLLLRVPTETTGRSRSAKARGPRGAGKAAPIALDDAAQVRFDALKAWRAAIAREHNLPAYVVFHDATLGRDGARPVRSRSTSSARSAASARRSSTPTAPTSCGSSPTTCSAQRVRRPRRPPRPRSIGQRVAIDRHRPPNSSIQRRFAMGFHPVVRSAP